MLIENIVKIVEKWMYDCDIDYDETDLDGLVFMLEKLEIMSLNKE